MPATNWSRGTLRPNSEVRYVLFGLPIPVVEMELGTADFEECTGPQAAWSEGAAPTASRWVENTPTTPGQSPSSRAAPWGGGAQLLSSEYPHPAASWTEGTAPAAAFTEGSAPAAAWTERSKAADNWTEGSTPAATYTEGALPSETPWNESGT
jgi:hypothetical protein